MNEVGGQAAGEASGAQPAAAPVRDPNDPDDLTGTTLAGERYTLVRILGKGGMGYVYEAKHNVLRKRVAIKVLSRQFCNNEELVERFVREARSSSMLEHENVIDVTDFGTTPQGSVFICMELLQGESLGETIRSGGALSWQRAKPMILQVCRAMHVAHSKGVMHRDLKPDNCFRTKRGGNPDFIKVLDFGLAKVFGDDVSSSNNLTQAGSLFGTPEYMSPEQAQGHTTDPRTDVYAVGTLLYEMMTARTPFVGDNFMQVLTQQVYDKPPRPLQVRLDADVSPELEKVILKTLAKDPKHRYQTIRELASALAAIPVEGDAPITAGIPVVTGSVDALPAVASPWNRLTIALLVSNAVLLLAVVALLLR